VPDGVSIVFWIVAGIGVAIVAALGLQVVTIHPFQWGFLVNAVVIVLAVELALGLACFVFTRRLESAVRCAVAIAILVLWWSTLASAVSILGQEYVEGVLTALTAGTIGYVIFRFGRARGAVAASGVLIFTVVAVAVIQTQFPVKADQRVGEIVESIDPGEELPDFLIVILDGYARDDTLRNLYSTDNQEFRSELEGMGFTVNQDARSNYNRTYASVASILALDTVITPDGDTEAELSVMRSVDGGDGEFLRAFKRAGYSVTFAPSIWAGSYCGSVVDRCVEIGVTQHNVYWLLRTSLLAPIASRLMPYPWSAASWERVTNLADIHLESRNEGPTITWIHVALPHPPVTRGSGCELHKDEWRQVLGLSTGGFEDGMRRDAFAEQTECIDSVVIDQLRSVVDADPDIAVLVLSDHGPDGQMQSLTSLGEHTRGQIQEKLSVLLAFRGPDRCADAAGGGSVVTVMRSVTGCMLRGTIGGTPAGFYLVPHEEEIGVGFRPVYVATEDLP
jgi:hypothetical protein